eukprot:GEMP01025190.1.p1 GENE.GEMP01025190.1~~GEMP01025190.1.p1  ORF type:complete len:624 (+),score=125.32 GEMP01025190.1:22-1893(+)
MGPPLGPRGSPPPSGPRGAPPPLRGPPLPLRGPPLPPISKWSPPPAPKALDKLTEPEIRRIWQQIDRNNSGSAKVVDLVKHSQLLEKKCPQVLKRFEEITKDGCVKYADFRDLLLGKRKTSSPTLALGTTSGANENNGKPVSKMLTEVELKQLWDKVSNDKACIQLTDIIAHKDFLRDEFPDLVTAFECIDSKGDGTISFEELKVYNGGAIAWLDDQLKGIIGLHTLKEQIRKFYLSVILDEKRRQQGFQIGDRKAIHMIFQGNPGTGKTSVARIMAKLLAKVGLIELPGKLTEVQRSDLVAEYVGQTGPKTKKVLEESKNGLLFIDEAYRLSSGKTSDFGREAIEELMAAMNEPPGKSPVMIFAGYGAAMGDFMKANDGLYRRISYTFDFEDYDCESLAQILKLYVAKNGFTLELSVHSVASIIEDHTIPECRAMMNGGLCERVFTSAKQRLDTRTDHTNPSIVLVEEDLRWACIELPLPPGMDPGDGAISIPAAIAMAKLKRNVIVEVVSTHEVRLPSRAMCGYSYVLVRTDKREVFRARRNPKKSRSNSIFDEQRILEVSANSHILEFVLKVKSIFCQDQFVANGVLAFSQLPFEGRVPLSKNDRPVGYLRVTARWQSLG